MGLTWRLKPPAAGVVFRAETGNEMMTINGTTRTVMKIRLLATAAILLSASAPSFAAGTYHHHHRHHAAWSHGIFLHNYGPPDFYPGTTVPPDRVVVPVAGGPYGIYDGFVRHCGQSSANYVGQDGGRHPCN
jgi:hypothetical protein